MRTDLAARYGDERLPRYTSYPTAPHFTPSVDAGIYDGWLRGVPGGLSGSLYLHVPFCRAMCWYCGCNTTVARRDGPVEDFLDLLRREIALVAERLPQPLPVRHLHFGGGTPTIVTPAAFLDLIGLLYRHFRLQPGAEIAIEVDPRTLTKEMIAALGEAGVTRASLGVQSFDPAVQRAINRVQSFAQTAAAAAGLRAKGVGGINVDLIYGLPLQTVSSCVATVEQCLALRPDRFSVFGYAHVPAFKKHQRKIREADLPDGAARHEQAEAIAAALQAAGYRRIGLDHFALPEDEMTLAQARGLLRRNFQGYTTDPADLLLGFGPSAIGRLPQGHVQNEAVLGRYAAAIGADRLATVRGYALTAEDRFRAALIERLMCDFEVDLAPLCAGQGTSPAQLLQGNARLQAMAADGVVRLEGDRVAIPEQSRFLVRSVAAAFDAHLAAGAGRHSRAV